MHIGVHVTNVTLRGGIYKGDKDTHDYSKREFAYTPGTHEGGYGIITQGAHSVTIEAVTATHFIGDGLVISGHGSLISDIYEAELVSGEYDTQGKAIANKDKVRTSKAIRFDHKAFKTNRDFEISNIKNLPTTFDIYIFDKSKKLISKLPGKKNRETIQIPEGADYFHLVFQKASSKGSYLEVWNRVVSKNVVVKNSEFAHNRRQGITVAGADTVLIENNEIHHIKGTMPQSGIDLEGGYGENGQLNSRIVIKGNNFHNNESYDVILYDGKNAIVEDNRLGSRGKIGLAISPPFTGALVRNNHFDGSRILAYHDATFLNNRMNDSYTTFEGPNVTIDGLTMTDSTLTINSKQPFGVTASNVTITSINKSLPAGLSLWGKPIKLSNITISGESSLRTVAGGIEPGSIIDNLKVTDFNSTYGISLPAATYNNCEISGAAGAKTGSIGVAAASGGPYVFNNCKFKASSTAFDTIVADQVKLDLTIKNSSFELSGNTRAINVVAAKKFVFENNSINATGITSDKLEIVKLNDFWKRNEQHDILSAIIKGNTISSNLKAIGISTIYAGNGAPAYVIENNTIVNATLALKPNDQNLNNTVK
nr:right-handed parallel beta-helix repeat-containing protein [Paenibacillus sp. GSMTC-2017]